MKMFKKLFAVLVLGFMSVLFLTACDGKMQDGVCFKGIPARRRPASNDRYRYR